MATHQEVAAYIALWKTFRAGITPVTAQMDQLRQDLYQVRNGQGSFPAHLIHSDAEVMAAAEHYFLCRAWVGNGVQPAWQMRLMSDVYNIGKKWGITPQHNPDNPVTPYSDLQAGWQELGVQHGEADLRMTGGTAPTVAEPPMYY